jgi:beta-carotene ketolase (CrtO type)
MLDHQELNKRGELGEQIPFYAALPSAIDRSLVPPGNKGNTLYIYVPSSPRELAHGERWEDQQDKYLQQILGILEHYSPGIQSHVIGTYIKSPPVFSRYVYNAHPYHADMSLSQMGPWRPVPSMSGFTTPIKGLWHASAGNHPFPAVHGWGGRSAARELIRGERRSPFG